MTGASGIVGEFLALKAETDADVLAMQCGDFYEFFAEDAEVVADELDLTVSQKSSGGESYPMAGVPVDDLTPYAAALVERGYRVAVADQYETADGHAREIARVVTPGTLLDATDGAARYIASVVRADGGGSAFGLAVADATTGEFHCTEIDGEDAAARVRSELLTFDPAEVLPGPRLRTEDAFLAAIRERTDAAISLHATEAFAPARARHRVGEQFGEAAIESVGVGDANAAVAAAGALVSYVEDTGVGTLSSFTRLQAYGADDRVELDATTQRNLELTETMSGDREGSLIDVVDHTVTAAGGRLLARWLRRPRQDRREIERRQACVAAFAESAMAREELRDALEEVYDVERLASRSVSGSADARALRAVADTLARFEAVADIVAETDRLADSPVADRLDAIDRDAVADLAAEIDAAVVEDPPGTVTQGEIIARGYDVDLDDVIERHETALDWIDGLPSREKDRTGITHLSVDRNTTDGYYIQVGKSETDGVPEAYEEIKTLKNSKRYTTEALQEREREVLGLEERRHEMEYELFEALRERVGARAELLQDVGRALAEVDVLAGLAVHAVRADWTRPAVTADGPLDVDAGRHPVVEQTTEFVPNDCRLDDDRSFLLVTGPNMSGKSTYMRQVALITLLAQVGSFVPAQAARVPVVDGIYTRVGALDELAQGRSTFMVEMQELSNILHSATEDSLVILDEVGRGTATYDGISIAWAATEYIHNHVRSKTLFATHYHELTALADHLERVANVHVAADESDGEVAFLRTVREGPTDRSYGIHVADLAGVPAPVVDRSRTVLERLREEKAVEARGSGGGDPVQTVFDVSSGSFRKRGGGSAPERASADGGEAGAADPALDPETQAVLAELEELDLESTAPIDLLDRVREWRDRLSE
jgi:DNA mismatch repair protein MutS